MDLFDGFSSKKDEKTDSGECVKPTNATEELCAMAVVLYGDKILATKELIYGKEKLSLPKGHKEDGETIVETAIRECFEETNVVVSENDLAKKLTPFSYEFSTPTNKLIKKTVAPFLFEVKDEGKPMAKEKQMISVDWMNKDDFLEKCNYESVKTIVKSI